MYNWCSTAKRPPMETMGSPPAILKIGYQHTCNDLHIFHPGQGRMRTWESQSPEMVLIFFYCLIYRAILSQMQLKNILFFSPFRMNFFFFATSVFFTLKLKFQWNHKLSHFVVLGMATRKICTYKSTFKGFSFQSNRCLDFSPRMNLSYTILDESLACTTVVTIY